MISFHVNGTHHQVDDSRGREVLLDYLQGDLNLTGTKLCCGIGVCRACTVAVAKGGSPAEAPTIACSTPLHLLGGTRIRTVEGVAEGETLTPVQDAFLRHFSFQCGYCAPGFVMAATMFLDSLSRNPVPVADLDSAIEDAIGAHICRCSGYVRYYQALREVAMDVISDPEGDKA